MTNFSNRGQDFENILENTHQYYFENEIAFIIKNPVPIKVLKIQGHLITKAFFQKEANPDFTGVYQGNAISFDAKSTNNDKFYLNLIPQHQIEFLTQFSLHQGVAFILIYFRNHNAVSLIPIEKLNSSIENNEKYLSFAKFNENNDIIYYDSNEFFNYIFLLDKLIN